MANTELLIHLRDLHDQLVTMQEDLSECEGIDERTIDALGQLVTDTSQLVDRANEKMELEQSDTEMHNDIADRVRTFQSHHPAVTKFLSQLTDLLGMIGI